jgi:hypothetical protein
MTVEGLGQGFAEAGAADVEAGAERAKIAADASRRESDTIRIVASRKL